MGHGIAFVAGDLSAAYGGQALETATKYRRYATAVDEYYSGLVKRVDRVGEALDLLRQVHCMGSNARKRISSQGESDVGFPKLDSYNPSVRHPAKKYQSEFT
jgi:hypothetical protein